MSAKAFFTGRANSTSGTIFTGLFRPNATHLVSYIGVKGKRIIEIVTATLTFTYRKKI